MNLLKSLTVTLQGKKTYIVATITAILGILQLLGIQVDGCSVQDPIQLLLASAGLASLRAGIARK